MLFGLQPLPTDPKALLAYATAMQGAFAELQTEHEYLKQEVEAGKSEIYEKTILIEKLRCQLEALKRNRYGRSSEKLERQIDQLEFALEEMEIDIAAHVNKAAPARSAVLSSTSTANLTDEPSTPRREFPAHLPRERIEHKAACACPSCGGTKLAASARTSARCWNTCRRTSRSIVHARPKMSCRACETIMQPPMPSLPIERGLARPALCWPMCSSAKYCDHLPLYRQSGIYARDGRRDRTLDHGRLGGRKWLSCLSHWRKRSRRMCAAGEALHADDTPVPVLDPGRGKTKTGRLWVAVRDERPWGSGVPPAVFYRYAPDRKAERAEALLKDCRGYLHADALCRVQHLYRAEPDHRDRRACRSGLLGACAPKDLRGPCGRRHRRPRIATAGTDRRAVRDRRRRSGPRAGRAAAVRAHRAVPLLAGLKSEFETTLRKISEQELSGAGDPLRPVTLGRH